MFHSQPVPEELQNGESFGYIIAFRAFGEVSWTHVATSAPGASRYVYRNDSIAPFSPFHVKVGTYNSKGQGPFSPVVTIYSAEIGEEGDPSPLLFWGLFVFSGGQRSRRRERRRKTTACSRGRLIALHSRGRGVHNLRRTHFWVFIRPIRAIQKTTKPNNAVLF